jgi:hypothetical protein
MYGMGPTLIYGHVMRMAMDLSLYMRPCGVGWAWDDWTDGWCDWVDGMDGWDGWVGGPPLKSEWLVARSVGTFPVGGIYIYLPASGLHC